jgi:predicted Zn-dependent protease
VNYLLEAGVRPEAAAVFERNLRRFVFAGVLFAAFSVGAGFWTAARQVREAPREKARIEAEETAGEAKEAWKKGDPGAALAKAEAAAKGDAKWEVLLGDLLYEAGRVVEAKPHFLAAREWWREGSDERREIDQRLEEIRQMEERHKDE